VGRGRAPGGGKCRVLTPRHIWSHGHARL